MEGRRDQRPSCLLLRDVGTKVILFIRMTFFLVLLCSKCGVNFSKV